MRIASNKIKDILRYFKTELAEVYSANEIDAIAALCFEHYLGFSKTDLLIKQEESLNQSDLLKFSFCVKRLKALEPVQYILGEAYFYGTKFCVSPAVLIPRPETEELVDMIVNESRSTDRSSVLDIATGSGCIAISLAKNLEQAQVEGIDISSDAIEVAKSNNVDDFVKFSIANALDLKGDWLTKKWDIIVSNPPYIKLSEKNNMHTNVLAHEPHIALFVPNDDALIFYKAIADYACATLNKGGKLYFEINQALSNEVVDLLKQKGLTHVQALKDINNNDRFVKAIKA